MLKIQKKLEYTNFGGKDWAQKCRVTKILIQKKFGYKYF